MKDKKRKKKSGTGAKSGEKSSNRRKKTGDDIELATIETKDSNVARFFKHETSVTPVNLFQAQSTCDWSVCS